MRPTAAPLVLAMLLLPRLAAAADLVLLRDGSRREVELRSCVADRCTTSSGTIARADIAWIGFATAATAPPDSPAAAVDQLILRDGRIVVSPVLGISLGAVATAAGSHDRAGVAWVRFAAPGGGPEPEPPPAPTPQPTPEPTPEPPQPPADDGAASTRGSRQPGDPPVQPCPPGHPLGGHVVVDSTYRSGSMHCPGKARLWFDLVPTTHPRWPDLLLATLQSTFVRWELSSDGCTDGPNGPDVCTIPGGFASGEVDTRGGMGDPVRFSAIEPQLGFVVVPDEIENGLELRGECVSPNSRGDARWTVPASFSIEHRRDCDHPMVACVPPSGCHDDEGGLSRDCALHADRFAVIPFRGDALLREDHGAGESHTDRLRWDVCCGCGDRGPAPDMPAGGLCGDLGPDQALLERQRDEFRLRQKGLGEVFERFQLERSQADAWRDDFTDLVWHCHLFEIAKALTAYLAGRVPSDAPQHAKQMATLVDLIDKLRKQDASLLFAWFPEHVAGADAYGAFANVLSWADSVRSASNAGSIPEMHAKLESCLGTPFVADVTLADARLYLHHLERALALLPELQRAYRTTDQAGQELWRQEIRFHALCLAHAECTGRAAATCGPEPPPMPPGADR